MAERPKRNRDRERYHDVAATVPSQKNELAQLPLLGIWTRPRVVPPHGPSETVAFGERGPDLGEIQAPVK
jgi:hypothetical protein